MLCSFDGLSLGSFFSEVQKDGVLTNKSKFSSVLVFVTTLNELFIVTVFNSIFLCTPR